MPSEALVQVVSSKGEMKIVEICGVGVQLL